MNKPRNQSGPPRPKRRNLTGRLIISTALLEKNIYKTMVENVHDGILLFGPDGRIIEVNSSACTIHGYETCATMVDQQSRFPEIFDLYDCNDTKVPLERWPVSRALNGESVIDFECKCVRKDTGKTWYGLYSAFPLTDAAGNFLFAIVSIKDISLHKADQMERERILGQYRAITASMMDGLVIADTAGNILEMNPAALRRHEFPSADLMLKHLLEYPKLFTLYDSEGRKLPFDRWPMSRALYGETFSKAEVKVLRLDTGTAWYGDFGGTPVRDKNGNFILAIVTIHDVTEQKRKEDELFQSREEWVETFNAIPDLVSIIDNQNRIARVNRAMAEKLGVPADKAIGSCCYTCIHGTQAPPPSCPHAAMLKDGIEHKTEMHENHLGGDFLISVTPIYDKNGHVKGSVHVARDITERKRAEEELRLKNSACTIANQELESFSYSVSHDLRNPLHAIEGCLEVLRAKGTCPENDYQEAIAIIARSAGRMSQVISDLLALAGMARREPHCVKVDLGEIARSIIEELKASEPQRKVATAIEPGLVVEADPGLALILMENLLRNAWKFTAKGPNARIEIGSIRKASAPVTYFVRDNGVGFDMADAGKIFKPFQRLHKDKEFPGTGIGLATVKRIVDKHGGAVWAEAEKDKGATFYFRLE